MKLNILQEEATKLITNTLKLGVIATISTMANNIYKIQALATMQHISTDIKQLPKSK